MKNYRIDILVEKRRGEFLVSRTEIEREHFTINDYKDCVKNMFEIACRGYEFQYLVARISCDGSKFVTLRLNTEVDGSDINAYLFSARPREVYRFVRKMNIAS